MKSGVLLVLLAWHGAAQAACFDGAENTPAAWSMSSLWHIEDASQVACAGAHAGTHAYYFGIDGQCNYDDHNVKDGSLTSPPFTVTGFGDTDFSFWTKWQVESMNPGCYDQLYIEYIQTTVTAATWNNLAEIGPPDPPSSAPGAPGVGIASLNGFGGDPGWIFIHKDLSFLAGNTIQLRFRFASSACLLPLCDGKTYCGTPDSDFDNFLGWVVDDISYGCSSGSLSLAKSASPGFAARGNTVTYTISASNLSPVAQALSVWDTLPSGANFLSASMAPVQTGPYLFWSLASVPANATQAITMLVQVDPSTAYPSDWWNTASGDAGGLGQFMSPIAPVKIRDALITISKTARPSTLTSGDQVTFTISVSNFSSVMQPQIDVLETYPVGFVELGSYPSYASYRSWKALGVLPGDTRYFTVWGFANGFNGQVLTNRAEAFVGGASQGSASASIKLIKPEIPQLSLKSVYPNPAPSGKAGLPQSAFIVYEINQAMDLTLNIYTVAGEKVRTIAFQGARGVGQVEWDLKNESGAKVASGIYVARLWVNVSKVGLIEGWAHIAVLQ